MRRSKVSTVGDVMELLGRDRAAQTQTPGTGPEPRAVGDYIALRKVRVQTLLMVGMAVVGKVLDRTNRDHPRTVSRVV